jgi:hypothetical protein
VHSVVVLEQVLHVESHGVQTLLIGIGAADGQVETHEFPDRLSVKQLVQLVADVTQLSHGLVHY